MDQSILFIKILAVYFVISGLFLLIKGKTLPLILKDFFSHPAIVYLTGVILMFLGLAILIQNKTADPSVKILAGMFGWLVLLKGLVYIFMPKILSDLITKKFHGWFGGLGLAALILGIYLFFVI